MRLKPSHANNTTSERGWMWRCMKKKHANTSKAFHEFRGFVKRLLAVPKSEFGMQSSQKRKRPNRAEDHLHGKFLSLRFPANMNRCAGLSEIPFLLSQSR